MSRDRCRPFVFLWLMPLTLLACSNTARKPSLDRQGSPPAMRPADQAPLTKAQPIVLTYAVQVPKDVSQKMKFHPKHDKPYEDDAHAMYRRAHRRGWQECVQTYLQGKLAPKSTASIKQQFGLQQQADRAGFLQCRKDILALIKRHGTALVKAALAKQHGAPK